MDDEDEDTFVNVIINIQKRYVTVQIFFVSLLTLHPQETI